MNNERRRATEEYRRIRSARLNKLAEHAIRRARGALASLTA